MDPGVASERSASRFWVHLGQAIAMVKMHSLLLGFHSLIISSLQSTMQCSQEPYMLELDPSQVQVLDTCAGNTMQLASK